MLGDEAVLEDKPGICPNPKCMMKLVPVRLETAWSCPNHPVVVESKPGRCPIDKRDLVPVTVNLYWTCPQSGNDHLLEPGRCADGTPREEKREARAHGDHNPRHGGQFFMASDNWHHLEGTYPRDGLFRIFIYDQFTKPLDATRVSGRAVLSEERDPVTGAYKESESVPLTVLRDGKSIEARISNKTLPLKVTAKVKLDDKLPEQRFDFTFTEHSKEPVAVTKVSPPGDGRTSISASASPVAPERALLPEGTVSARSEVSATSPATAATMPVTTECSGVMSPADAAQRAEALPRTVRELVKLLTMCNDQMKEAVANAQFGSVIGPVLLSKDAALALEGQSPGLSESKNAQASDAIRRLVLSAWKLDYDADTGDQAKLAENYRLFAAALIDIESAYAVQP